MGSFHVLVIEMPQKSDGKNPNLLENGSIFVRSGLQVVESTTNINT